MLTVSDIRQTRVWQEAFEEGIEQEKIRIAAKMIEMGYSIGEIGEFTELSSAKIRKLKKKSSQIESLCRANGRKTRRSASQAAGRLRPTLQIGIPLPRLRGQ
jgi:predicted transposase YdaD